MYESEKVKEIKIVIKYIFYIVLAAFVYLTIKYINEHDVTLSKTSDEISEATIRVSGNVLDESLEAGNKAFEKTTIATQNFFSQAKEALQKNIKMENKKNDIKAFGEKQDVNENKKEQVSKPLF